MWRLQEQELASGVHAKSLQEHVPLKQARHCTPACVEAHPGLTPASLLYHSYKAQAQQVRGQTAR